MRIMGIDYGDVRVGIALTDPMQIIASPFAVLSNDQSLFREIQRIILEQDVGEIAVGWPLNSKNEMTAQTRKVKAFIKKLKAETGLPVFKVDEAYSTREAEKALLAGDVSRKKRKKSKDRMAASLILSYYLETRTV